MVWVVSSSLPGPLSCPRVFAVMRGGEGETGWTPTGVDRRKRKNNREGLHDIWSQGESVVSKSYDTRGLEWLKFPAHSSPLISSFLSRTHVDLMCTFGRCLHEI